MEIEAALSDGLADMLCWHIWRRLWFACENKKSVMKKKGMCETCPELNGKRDGEKPNDGIRFAVGQLISFRLVLQSLRRCFACKIFDFFAMRVKP